MENIKEMLRPADIAALLGCTTARIYQMCRSGELPHTRMGKAVLIPRRAWEAWVCAKNEQALASLTGSAANDTTVRASNGVVTQTAATGGATQSDRKGKE